MKRRILIGLAVVAFLPICGIVALFAIREPPDGPRVEVEPGIVGIEAGGAYAWIVRTRNGAVLVDAGLDAAGKAIFAELTSQRIMPDQVQAILLTHGHPDHYAAAPLFERAQVFVGSTDIAMLRGDRTHHSAFGKLMSAIMPLPEAPSTVKELNGNERLEFDGAQFTVIATPGHSPGSVMYLHRNVLFTGDSLMRKKDGVAIAPALFSENAAQNRASLSRLESLPFDKLADGHAGVTRDARSKLHRLLADQ